MAGAGYKLFNTGDVLTAQQVNEYLMQQTVMVFADASARTTALSGVLAEGMISYLKDTNAVERYDGSSWSAIGDGDIQGVTAGTGMSGGGTSGTVTLTNDMATTITASGDIVVGTGNATYDNLPIGTTGQVLTADTTVSPYKVKWASVSAGGMTLLSTTTLSGTSTTISNISQDYNSLFVLAYGASWSGSGNLQVLPNAANNLFSYIRTYFDGSSTTTNGGSASTIQTGLNTNNGTNVVSLQIDNYTSTSNYKTVILYHIGANPYFAAGGLTTNSAITSLRFEQNGAASMTGGTVLLYGVK